MKLTLGHHYNFDTNYTFVPSAETVDSYEGEIIVQSSGSRFPGAMYKSNGCVYDTTNLYWGRYIENPFAILIDKLENELNSMPKCDCGGMKTYNSMEPWFHSTWCGGLK